MSHEIGLSDFNLKLKLLRVWQVLNVLTKGAYRSLNCQYFQLSKEINETVAQIIFITMSFFQMLEILAEVLL